MKYIRKAKNTKQKGRMADEFVTETIDESLFTPKHEALGGWEKVSDEECERLCSQNETVAKEFKEERQAERKIRRAKQQKLKAEKDALINAEFEEFKAWKASQGSN